MLSRVNLVYRFKSENTSPFKLRLKIEINTREHFTELGVKRTQFEVNNPWFKGSANIATYQLEELLCTKFRALYQRKKGRDLFDIWHAVNTGHINKKVFLTCFQRYMSKDGLAVTRAQFEANLAGKRKQPDFRDDVQPLLRPGLSWNFDVAMNMVLESLVSILPGDPWQGE